MKPFFSYYGSKARLCAKKDFYPAPSGVVCEPFAGSASYCTYHNVERAILIEKDPKIAELWRFLISAEAEDIEAIPTALTDEIYKDLKGAHKTLVGFWICKGRTGLNVNVVGAWYHRFKNETTCRVWGAAVKRRIIAQLPAIKNWKVICGDYLDAPIADTYFIDPPYSGKAGRSYKFNKMDWSKYFDWVNSLPVKSTIIACENANRVIDLDKIKGEQRERVGQTANAAKPTNEICVIRFAHRFSVLFARSDSIYKSIPGLDVFDIERNALTVADDTAGIYHPPCRLWGQLKHLASPRRGERKLTIWAVARINKFGGVLEHPINSDIFRKFGFLMNGGIVVNVDQCWFGHRARKATGLYIKGLTFDELPPFEKDLTPPTHQISGWRVRHKKSGEWVMPLIELPKKDRDKTPERFANWLVEICDLINAKKARLGGLPDVGQGRLF